MLIGILICHNCQSKTLANWKYSGELTDNKVLFKKHWWSKQFKIAMKEAAGKNRLLFI